MIYSKESKERMEAMFQAELDRINRRGDGRPMSLAEMEDLVSEIGDRVRQRLLDGLTAENRSRISAEKKTVRSAENPGHHQAPALEI
jgi:hypothetical protein